MKTNKNAGMGIAAQILAALCCVMLNFVSFSEEVPSAMKKLFDQESFTISEFADFQLEVGEEYDNEDAQLTGQVLNGMVAVLAVGTIFAVIGYAIGKKKMAIVGVLVVILTSGMAFLLAAENEAYVASDAQIIPIILSIVGLVLGSSGGKAKATPENPPV